MRNVLIISILFASSVFANNHIEINGKSYKAEYSFSTEKVVKKKIQKVSQKKKQTAKNRKSVTPKRSVTIQNIIEYRKNTQHNFGLSYKHKIVKRYKMKLTKKDLERIASLYGADLILYDVQGFGPVQMIKYVFYKKIKR